MPETGDAVKKAIRATVDSASREAVDNAIRLAIADAVKAGCDLATAEALAESVAEAFQVEEIDDETAYTSEKIINYLFKQKQIRKEIALRKTLEYYIFESLPCLPAS